MLYTLHLCILFLGEFFALVYKSLFFFITDIVYAKGKLEHRKWTKILALATKDNNHMIY